MIDRTALRIWSGGGDRGFVVVAVLWILGLLSGLASVYLVYVVNTAAGLADFEDNLRAEALVSAALELTAMRQLNVPAAERRSRGQFNFNLGAATADDLYGILAALGLTQTNPLTIFAFAAIFAGVGADVAAGNTLGSPGAPRCPRHPAQQDLCIFDPWREDGRGPSGFQ